MDKKKREKEKDEKQFRIKNTAGWKQKSPV